VGVRVVALGDSTVCGMGVPLPDGHWRGFAALAGRELLRRAGVADCPVAP
jgi:hypothetical protein